jgi:hypothetical protein
MKVELDREHVVLYTQLNRVEGEVHLPSTARLSDRLNAAKDFVPITSARVFSLDGNLLYTSDMVLVHKAHIVMIMERHETA